MKTTKLIIGIISCVLCIVVLLQSCAAGVVTTFTDTTDVSAVNGMFFMVALLISGIIGIATRNSKGGGIVAAIFYAISGIIGVSSAGVYKDLNVWGVVALVFAALQFICSVAMKNE